MAESVGKVEGLNCPNCGAAQEIRAFGQAITVVCPNCHSILDAKDPKLRVLQEAETRQRVRPLIPLGKRGKLHGVEWEVVGFQVRATTVEGVTYSWREYVLFNPYKGFRYLTEYDGHWNDVKPLNAIPGRGEANLRPYVSYLGRRYSHFQTGEALTTFVLGEFPWQVRVGERVKFRDFVSPPMMMSEEATGGETTWSLGEYMTGTRVFEAFKMEAAPPPAIGIFSNQPAPDYGLKGFWTATLFLLLALSVLAMAFATLAAQQEVFRATYLLQRTPTPFVTDVFEFKGGRPTDVVIDTKAPPNTQAYFHYALINQDNGRAWDFGRELSEEGGDRAVIPSVPAGKYYLRVEPEVQENSAGANFEIRVRRDVPVYSFYVIAALLILVPPLARSVTAGRFEGRRWQESDYASG